MGGEPVLAVRGLVHAYGDGGGRKQTLHGVDLEVGQGEIVLLMGPSGCGKTTVLTLAGGLRSVQGGSVRVLGHELAGADEPALRSVRRRIGFIFQNHNLHASLTALRNVRMALEVHGPEALKDWRERCGDALREVGLGDRLDHLPAQLSGGQRQRVAIARAIVARPSLILSDEATAALDRRAGREVVELIRRLARERGTGVLMVTHDNRILDVADRILDMEDGRVVGTSDAVTATGPGIPRVEEAVR
jgi:putative ABC transport system ATP-binding protein